MQLWSSLNVFLALPFFGIEMKTDLFQSCGHCWVFQICQHIECSTFTASSFRIWNSSAGIPSPPPALFIMMFPKAKLTLHFRIPGSSEWSHCPGYLGHEHFCCIACLCVPATSSFFFFFNLFVFYLKDNCHLFLISSSSVGSYRFCSLLCLSLHEMFPWYL